MPSRILRQLAVLAVLAAAGAAACATRQRPATSSDPVTSTAAGAPGQAAGRPQSRRDVITRDEIARSTAANALELVRQLRPSFLSDRGPQSFQNQDAGRVIVYLNGTKYGFLDSLSQIPTVGITEIRHFSATEATQRWGIGHSGGVIYVTVGS